MPAWLCFLFVPLQLSGAVVYQDFPRPLGINTLGRDHGVGPAYRIDGTLYRFHWLAAPHPFDFDGNGSVDLTIGGSRRSENTDYMFVTQHGRNQVWSIAGGASGGDFGSFALALLGGTSIGPSLHNSNPAIGWHNDDDTGARSILTQAYGGRPINGDFLPQTLFERKYLGFVLNVRGPCTMAGWRFQVTRFGEKKSTSTLGPMKANQTRLCWSAPFPSLAS